MHLDVRKTYRENFLPQTYCGVIARNGQRLKISAFDLEHSEVIVLVHLHDFGREHIALILDFNAFSFLDDVMIRHQVAVLAHEKAGTDRPYRSWPAREGMP